MNRAGYPTNDNLNDRINALQPGEHRAFLEREASLVVGGHLLRHLPFLKLTADPRETRGARAFLEILTLARGLAFLGYANANAARATHPDFEVTLPDGRDVGVEATDAYRTGVYEGRMYELRSELLNAVDLNAPALHGRLITISSKAAWDSGLAVNLGAEPDVPVGALPFKERDVNAFVSEFVAWLSAGEHAHDREGLEPFEDLCYPQMTSWNVVISSRQMTGSHTGAVEFILPNIGQSAEQVKGTVLAALARKQGKAMNYGASRPLWLFIEIADRVVRASRALEEFAKGEFQSIAPYELVLVIHDGFALAVDAGGGVQRMDMTSPARAAPFWPGY